MKAAPFAYHRPDTVDEAVDALAGGDAKVLAGGQSLVPVLAMRLGRPGTLVDITGSCGSARPCANARWSGPRPRGRSR
jgi:CO/xanthine dehydrogenase FAD-binding subunit